MPSWASDLIKTDESIIAGIESAGKKYDDGDNGNESVKKEEKEMVKSTGFDVDRLEKNKKSSQEEEDDEEEFSFRPAYSRQVFQTLVAHPGKLQS